MEKNINLCIVAGTHGDEFAFGQSVQRQVAEVMPGKAYNLTGNPRAARLHQRYIDSDLNRAFDGSGHGYEAERMREIRAIFRDEDFTHVVDLHTSPTTHSVVPIIPEACYGTKSFEVVSVIEPAKDIVIIPEHERASSLTGSFGRGGVGLECPRYTESHFASIVANGLIAFLSGKTSKICNRKFYYVEGLIPLSISLGRPHLEDFEKVPEMDGLAFVADPNTYGANYGHQGMLVNRSGDMPI
jgi:predicted deacylase